VLLEPLINPGKVIDRHHLPYLLKQSIKEAQVTARNPRNRGQGRLVLDGIKNSCAAFQKSQLTVLMVSLV